MDTYKLDGKVIADEINSDLAVRVESLKRKGVTPTLAVVIVGDDAPSRSYVSQKRKACERIGAQSEVYAILKNSELSVLLDTIKELNKNDGVHGVLVHLPLKNLSIPPPVALRDITYGIMETIDPLKDVDGFHPINSTRFVRGQPCLAPATARGIVRLLDNYKIDTQGKYVVIAGVSEIVGRPLGNVLVNRMGSTVTFCHDKTPDVLEHSRRADIFISAIGQAHYFGADSIKEGAVVVDVGTSRVEDKSSEKGYKLLGDFDDSIWGKASCATPVPGGVGPMTVACLLENLVSATEYRNGSS